MLWPRERRVLREIEDEFGRDAPELESQLASMGPSAEDPGRHRGDSLERGRATDFPVIPRLALAIIVLAIIGIVVMMSLAARSIAAQPDVGNNASRGHAQATMNEGRAGQTTHHG